MLSAEPGIVFPEVLAFFFCAFGWGFLFLRSMSNWWWVCLEGSGESVQVGVVEKKKKKKRARVRGLTRSGGCQIEKVNNDSVNVYKHSSNATRRDQGVQGKGWGEEGWCR